MEIRSLRLADERLWIDALERGVYDVILEPFRGDELRSILVNANFRATEGGSAESYVLMDKREALVCVGSFIHWLIE